MQPPNAAPGAPPDMGPPLDPGPPDGGPPPEGGSPLARLRLAAYFLRYLRPVKGLVVLVLIVTGFGALTRLPMTFLPKVLTEHLNDLSYLWWYLVFVFAALAVGWLLSVLMSYWGELLGELVVRRVRHDVFSNMERLSMLSVYSRGPGEFVQQLDRDVVMVRGLIGNTLLNSGMEVALGTTTLVSMLILNAPLTLILLVVFLLMGIVIRWINQRVERFAGQARDLMLELVGRLVENVGGFRDIVASGRFSSFTARFDELLQEGQRLNVLTAVWGQLSGLVPSMLVSLAVLAVYVLGLNNLRDLSEQQKIATIGDLITYAALLSQLFPAILAAARSTTDLALAMPSLQSLRDMLEQPPPAGDKEAVALEPPIRSIRFDHVHLDMNGRPVVNDMSFDIPVGKMVAIVGQSGAGKTTLFHLLLRLIEPSAGAVRINDRPLPHYSLESLRRTIGFLPQNAFIFNQSLRENILLATPQQDVSAEKLQSVIELAQLSEVLDLRRNEGGLEAQAGYMGNRLSAGERQRIALARLILRDPQVIICDEYTANVDVKTARLIQEAMQTHFAGRTRVIITHELYSVRGADWIIVIDHGRVVQQGTPDELAGQPGLYRDLLTVQSV
jgi:ABC-type multidrug transport system fused ATPase/permease subunit